MSKFYNYFEHYSVPTLLWKKGEITDCNPAALSLFGTESINTLNKRNAFDSIDQKVFEQFLKSSENNGSSLIELTFPSIPGQFILNSSILAEEEGLILSIVRNSESSLNELHSRENGFQSIVENSHDVIMRFDKNHRHIYVNSVVAEQTQIPVKEYIGRTHEELGFPVHLCKLWGEALNHVFTSGDYHRIEFALPNGIYIDWSLVPELNSQGEIEFVVTTARDITKIKHAEVELLKGQTKFIDAFELARLATWETDLINSQVILNAEFCSIVGLNFDDENPTMASSVYYNDFVHDADKEAFMDKLSSAVKIRNSEHQDILSYRVNRPDGTMIWLLATIRIDIDSSGNVYKAYGTCQDITYIKNTEAELEAHQLHLEELVEQRTLALRQSENKLIDAINLAKLSTWEYRVGEDLILIEGLLERRLDKSLFSHDNYLKLHSFIDAIYPDDYKMFYDAIEQSFKSSDRDYYEVSSFRIYDINRQIRHVNVTIKVELNEKNEVIRLYGTIQDFTHVVESKIVNERLTSIIEATSDIVAIINPNMEIVYLNKAGSEFYGINTDGNLQEPIENIQSPTSLNVLKEVWPIASLKGFWIGENKIRRFDGIEVPVSQIVIAHKLENGDLDCYSTIVRDISEQKKTEEDLIYKNNELDTFVYRASHDLRGPIASMLGLYNIVKHEVTDKTALEFFGRYNDQILRLNEVIVALIDLTRIKEKDAELEPINFEEVVNKTIRSFEHLPRFDKINFRIKIDFNHNVQSDKSLITTIIQNLIENAIKYSRSEANPFVNVHIKLMTKVGQGLVIKVQDNGLGIEERIQDKIFNMFFRGNTDSIGSGLGLYILKNAVDKLHGRILLSSRVGKGTLFKIELPFG